VTWRPLPERNEDRDPVALRASLDKVAKRFGSSSASAMSGLFERWDELVGASIAAHAKPISLKAGHLRVEVDSNAWATQLRFMTTELVERCCSALGPGAVKQIDIRVAR
jgi:predicted nucleic acid-binding Zn ribbon protein